MARSRNGGFRLVAIALVVETDDGSLAIIGSKSLSTMELEMRQEADWLNDDGYRHYIPTRQSYRIEAECHNLIIQHTVPVPTPPQIEQRGIYLPDMSFRAFPAPEET